MSEEKKNAKLNEEELEKVSGGGEFPEIRYPGGALGASVCTYLADGNKCTCPNESCPNNFVCGIFNESTYPKNEFTGVTGDPCVIAK